MIIVAASALIIFGIAAIQEQETGGWPVTIGGCVLMAGNFIPWG